MWTIEMNHGMNTYQFCKSNAYSYYQRAHTQTKRKFMYDYLKTVFSAL